MFHEIIGFKESLPNKEDSIVAEKNEEENIGINHF